MTTAQVGGKVVSLMHRPPLLPLLLLLLLLVIIIGRKTRQRPLLATSRTPNVDTRYLPPHRELPKTVHSVRNVTTAKADTRASKYSKTCLKRNAIVPVFFFPFSQVSVLQRAVF